MKREFLSKLGIENEVIDKIMAEHGKTVNSTKNDLEEIKEENKLLGEQIANYKDSADKVNKLIDDNETLKTGNEQLKSEYEQIKANLNETVDKHTKEITNIAKKQIIQKTLQENGVISDFQEFLTSKFDIEKLEIEGNTIKGIEDTFKNIQESNPKMFQEKKLSGTIPGVGSSPTINPEISVLEQQLNEARKSGNTALAMSLNEKIFQKQNS